MHPELDTAFQFNIMWFGLLVFDSLDTLLLRHQVDIDHGQF